MTTSRADLPLVVNRDTGAPMAAQISGQLRAAVTSGVLVAGERLPSTRDLATTLGVSRTVVTTAYAQLFAEGWLEGRHGSGTYVADVTPGLPPLAAAAAPPAMSAHPLKGAIEGTLCHPKVPLRGSGRARSGEGGSGRARRGEGGSGRARSGEGGRGEARRGEGGSGEGARGGAGDLVDLQPGIPWTEGIEAAMWRRAWRYAGTRPPSAWPDPHGLPELRAELAAYLRRSRGLGITPENVLVTRGVSGGLALLASAVVKAGDRVGVEEPGYESAREVLRRVGAQVLPCPVDEFGVIPEELPAGLRLLYTTPAHQYPLGGRLPVARRQTLTSWARSTGALIAEDDYDGEFRYDVAPLPAMYAIDPEVVVYLGTTSKILTPTIGVGWLAGPPSLVDLLARRGREVSDRVSEPAQRAVLEMLASGDLERHVRRMRLEYSHRRQELMRLPGLGGETAGMHVVLRLPPGLPAGELVARAADRGVGLYTLDRYYAGEPALNALILGYGATPLTKVRRAVAELRSLLPGECG